MAILVREIPDRAILVRGLPDREILVKAIPEREILVREIPVRKGPVKVAKAAPIKNATANKHIAIQANGGRHASSGRFACLTKLKKFPTMKDRRSTQRLNGEEHGTVSPAVALAMAEGALAPLLRFQ